MLVKNESPVELHISSRVLKPGASSEFYESMFNTLNVHSEIGSCIISTEYAERYIQNFGNLVAFEGQKKDKHGMKEIIIQTK